MNSCDQWGACCKGHVIVEAYALDVLREPQVAAAEIGEWTREMSYQSLMAELEQDGKCLIIAGGQECRFFRGDNTQTLHCH